ncbi:hypothetical protein RRF57_012706 [Xylaria bambusicola]|uniref:Uncharacterized protein n=1 Tax=Xylaria bambusicola TaxID=326684 RepID=A0AAN7V5W8_9PEZI
MQEAKQKQLELLAANVEIHELCCRWLNAIGIPVRDLPSAVTAARTSKSCSVLENGIGILDSDDEYEVYQDDSKPFGSLATPTSVKPHSVDVCDQPPSSLPSTPAPVAPALEQRPFTPERSVEAATGPPREIITTSPMNEITQIPQEAAMGISQEQLEFEAQQARLINELQTAIERGKREELAKKLLALFERDSHSAANVESDQSAHSVNGGAPNLLVTHVEESVSKGEEEIHMEQKRAEIVNIKEVQENLENAVLDEGRKTEPSSDDRHRLICVVSVAKTELDVLCNITGSVTECHSIGLHIAKVEVIGVA